MKDLDIKIVRIKKYVTDTLHESNLFFWIIGIMLFLLVSAISIKTTIVILGEDYDNVTIVIGIIVSLILLSFMLTISYIDILKSKELYRVSFSYMSSDNNTLRKRTIELTDTDILGLKLFNRNITRRGIEKALKARLKTEDKLK